MLSLCLPSLKDLSCIHFAYLMWTHHDVTQRSPREELFDELIEIVLAKVQKFPLPERVKSRVLQYVKPAGKHLLSVLSLWLPKVEGRSSQKWLTGEMLFECLTLNAAGLINQRITAEKLLGCRMLNNVIAFRLACINFMEKEVLRLWPHVKLYLVNKIILESEQPDPLESGNTYFARELAQCIVFDSSEEGSSSDLLNLDPEGSIRPTAFCSTEPYEVLFWIHFCLSKENGINRNESVEDWYDSALQGAARSGNVAFFDYFKNCSIEYNHLKMMRKVFELGEEDNTQPSFIFHFYQLGSEEKAELFQKFPKKVVSNFLQWPLSLTFLQNIEQIWMLIPDIDKNWVFLKLFTILFPTYSMLCAMQSDLTISSTWDFSDNHEMMSSFGVASITRLVKTTGMHNREQLKSIWITLWEMSHHSHKEQVLMTFPLSILYLFVNASRRANLREIFETAGLRRKLRHVFIGNGEAVLDLFEGDDLKEALRNLVAKHLPDDLEDLERRFISFLNSESFAHYMRMSKLRLMIPLDSPRKDFNLVYERFLLFIKELFYSSHSVDKKYFHK